MKVVWHSVTNTKFATHLEDGHAERLKAVIEEVGFRAMLEAQINEAAAALLETEMLKQITLTQGGSVND